MSEETKAGRGAEAGQVERPVRPLAWTDDRCAELELLGTLLREVASINHANNCLSRIARCIDLAERLSRDDLVACRNSLLSFLRAQAIDDRSIGPAA